MFRSHGERGQGTSCGQVFLASDEYGLPSDTTLECELEISPEEPARILALDLESLIEIPELHVPKIKTTVTSSFTSRLDSKLPLKTAQNYTNLSIAGRSIVALF